MNFRMIAAGSLTLVLTGVLVLQAQQPPPAGLSEVNDVSSPPPGQRLALAGALLIDGRGGPPVADSVVLVEGNRITAAGSRAEVAVPDAFERIDLSGRTLLPGLIDSHFHLEDEDLPGIYLQNGVTSVRDPGQWIEAYEGLLTSATPVPRLFLAGPHLDTPPPAYPHDSIIVRDPEETRLAVDRFIDQGASVIKVYFRLPLASIRAAVETAHARGVPVTAHLETVDADLAIRAGIDGLEHVTSCGSALLPLREGEVYRQSVLADNNARREGRYRVWSALDLDSSRVRDLIDLMASRKTFLSATLAVFERQSGDEGTTDMHVQGFRNMVRFVGLAHQAGVPVVVGSHSGVPHADRGWAYLRELELLVESGLSPLEAITAGTLQQARFFRIEDRLGTIEAGQLADLIVIEQNPLENISNLRRVQRVMLNGNWVR